MGDFDSYQNGTELYLYGVNSNHFGSKSYHFGIDSYQGLSGIFWNLSIKHMPRIQRLLEGLKCEIKIILSLKMTVLLRFLNS